MAAVDAVVLAAAVVGCLGAVVVGAAAAVLVGQVRRLERGIEALRVELLAVSERARRAADLAAGEMTRVDAVLADTSSVTATVDAAARLAQRTFASPIVKVLALRAGTAGGLRRLREPAVPGAGAGTNGSAPVAPSARSKHAKPPKLSRSRPVGR